MNELPEKDSHQPYKVFVQSLASFAPPQSTGSGRIELLNLLTDRQEVLFPHYFSEMFRYIA